MNDTRLLQVVSLLDDARDLLVEIVDEGPQDDRSVRDFNNIDAARQFINSASVYVSQASSAPTNPKVT